MSGLNAMVRVFLLSLAAALVAGCGAMLPFEFSVEPVIEESLRTKDADATGYAINDAGEVAGIYSRRGEKDRIFVFADGRLSLYEHPCDGFFHIRAFTNTKLIGGTCTYSHQRRQRKLLVVKLEDGGSLIEVSPEWPVEGYTLQAMNDRMDLIGANDDAYHRKKRDTVGFVYVAGKLRMIEKTDVPYSSYLQDWSLNESGVVVGGKRDPLSAKFGGKDIRPYVFQNGQFSILPLEKAATVVAMNDAGEVLFKVGGRKFGLLDKTYREIECGKEWCKVFGINNLGWVIGHGHNTYPVPPMGASIGHTFVWANEQLFNLDKSVRRGVNTDYPVRLSDGGHILFHSDGWPYLLTPAEEMNRAKAGALIGGSGTTPGRR